MSGPRVASLNSFRATTAPSCTVRPLIGARESSLPTGPLRRAGPSPGSVQSGAFGARCVSSRGEGEDFLWGAGSGATGEQETRPGLLRHPPPPRLRGTTGYGAQGTAVPRRRAAPTFTPTLFLPRQGGGKDVGADSQSARDGPNKIGPLQKGRGHPHLIPPPSRGRCALWAMTSIAPTRPPQGAAAGQECRAHRGRRSRFLGFASE